MELTESSEHSGLETHQLWRRSAAIATGGMAVRTLWWFISKTAMGPAKLQQWGKLPQNTFHCHQRFGHRSHEKGRWSPEADQWLFNQAWKSLQESPDSICWVWWFSDHSGMIPLLPFRAWRLWVVFRVILFFSHHIWGMSPWNLIHPNELWGLQACGPETGEGTSLSRPWLGTEQSKEDFVLSNFWKEVSAFF